MENKNTNNNIINKLSEIFDYNNKQFTMNKNSVLGIPRIGDKNGKLYKII